MSGDVTEQALLLGPRRSLVAVVSQSRDADAATRPTVVILNSGIVHRVGANRLNVRWARSLASRGYHAVRFDLSGLGDSEPRTDALEPLDAALADIREALDTLEASRGANRFILGGLCSGADHSVFYAPDDPRVGGAVLLDPTFPPPLRQYLHHYKSRLLERESWLNVIRGKNPLGQALRGKRPSAPPSPDAPVEERKVTDPDVRAILEGGYRRLVDRKIPLLAVLTGERWYYREALLDAFPKVPFGEALRLEYFPDADHVFSARGERDRLLRLLTDWTSDAASRA